MKRLMIAMAAVLVAGCGYNHYKDTTPTSVTSVELDRNLAGQTVSSGTTRTQSDWEKCMAENRGYDGAKAQCDAWMVAAKPGAMPKYQGWGWWPNYGVGYGGYSQQPYVTPGMIVR